MRRAIVASLAVLVSLSVFVVAAGLVTRAASSDCSGVPHAPVLITQDADFTTANGVLSGSGTTAHPYLIGALAINDLSRGFAVKIDNSAGKITKSFNVQCVTSTWSTASSSGGYVVWLINIHSTTSVSLVISNSGERPNSNGLRVEGSSNIVINNESFNKMGGDGIQVIASNHVTVIDTKSKAARNGLLIRDSHDITVGQTCNVGTEKGCDAFTYDDGRGIAIENSHAIQIIDTTTTADDTGGILLDGTGTYGIVLTGGESTANGPICHSGITSGYVSDTIAGIAFTNGAHDITVSGYTIQANGDGAGGYFDLMNGGNGQYLSPCGGPIVTMSPTPPGGANIVFVNDCYHFEFGFNPAPISSC